MNRRKGSILIFVLWILIVLTMMVASVGFRSRVGIKLARIFQDRSLVTYEALSAVNLASFLLQSDEDPLNDSKTDAWYGSPAQWETYPIHEHFSVAITDEESKLNLNKVTPEILQKFFQILKEHDVKLETDPDDLIGSIMAWRGNMAAQGKSTLGYEHKRAIFESIDELRLIQYMTPDDFETLKPFFTVHASAADFFLKVNLNTVHEWILEAIVKSLPGGDFEKDELIGKIEKARKGDPQDSENHPPYIFQTSDLTPQGLTERLLLSNSPQMIQLINLLTRFLTVDSQYFLIRLEEKEADVRLFRVTEIIVGSGVPILVKNPRGSGYSINNRMNNVLRGYPFEILSWHDQIQT